MDAFAITAVSRGTQWYRVEGVVGGDDAPARRFPRAEVLPSSAIADLLAGGRRVYCAQPSAGAPLVPLGPGAFDPVRAPLEDLPRFAFVEQASDEDAEALDAVRMRQDLSGYGLTLKRLEALDWVAADRHGVSVTPLGTEVLRAWHMACATPPALRRAA